MIATDNGDATCLITFSEIVRPAFYSLLLAIVKATPEARGKLKLSAAVEGLEKDMLEIEIVP